MDHGPEVGIEGGQNLLRRLGGAALRTTSSVSSTHINTPHGSGEVPANLS